MSAEVLHQAAALMCERAEAAEKVHTSPWSPMGTKSVVYRMTKHISGTVAETFPLGGSDQQAVTTAHIASWHPTVALAVADWLKSVAADVDKRDNPQRVGGRYEALRIPDEHAALTVARAYLGETL